MSGEWWGFLGVAIAALVGGSGVTGLLSGVVDFSKRNRLRRRVEKACTIRDLLPAKSTERKAVDWAIAVDSARLAAMSAIGMRPRIADRLPFFVAGGVFYVLAGVTLVLVIGDTFGPALFGAADAKDLPWPSAATALGAVGAAAVTFALIPGTVGRRRREWVEVVLKGVPPAEAMETIQKD